MANMLSLFAVVRMSTTSAGDVSVVLRYNVPVNDLRTEPLLPVY